MGIFLRDQYGNCSLKEVGGLRTISDNGKKEMFVIFGSITKVFLFSQFCDVDKVAIIQKPI
jgi:hypothetical protein